MSIFCKIGIHRWDTKFEEISWDSYDDYGKLKGTFYYQQNGLIGHSKTTPKIFYQRKGEIKHLPEGFFAFQRNHNPKESIFKRVRICKNCNKKKQLVSSLYDTGYSFSWEDVELSKNDLRDIKLNDLLNES